MTWDIAWRAFAATYLISVIFFLMLTYMGKAGDGTTRLLLTLLWPAYLLIWAIYFFAQTIVEICMFFLENFWNESFEEYSELDDDDDEPGEPGAPT